MRTPRAGRSTTQVKLAAILLGLAGTASTAPDFSGVWGMVQHSIWRRLPDLSF